MNPGFTQNRRVTFPACEKAKARFQFAGEPVLWVPDGLSATLPQPRLQPAGDPGKAKSLVGRLSPNGKRSSLVASYPVGRWYARNPRICLPGSRFALRLFSANRESPPAIWAFQYQSSLPCAQRQVPNKQLAIRDPSICLIEYLRGDFAFGIKVDCKRIL